MTITFDDYMDVLAEIARVFSPTNEIDWLLSRIGFPDERRPVASAPDGFWLNIGRMLRDGATRHLDPFRVLFTYALERFPGNATFQGVLDRHPVGPPAPPTGTTSPANTATPTGTTAPTGASASTATPGAAILFHGCQNVQSLWQAAQRVALRSKPPVAFEMRFSSRGIIYFHMPGMELINADPFANGVVAELSQPDPLVTFSTADAPFCDYLLSRLLVEGPDQARFELGDVPASTTAKDIARGIMHEYDPKVWGKDEQGRPRPAVVDHIRQDGTTARLAPEATLHESGVQDGDQLHVHPESRAGSVHPEYRDQALARVRIEVLDYAERHPGFEVLWNDPDFPTEYEFRFSAPSFAPPVPPETKPRPTDEHRVLLVLPADFPREAPQAYWRSPIFHPNIHRESGRVCLGALADRYRPGMDFGELCQMLVDMARFHNYVVTEGYDQEAQRWAVSLDGMAMIEARGGRCVVRQLIDGQGEGRPLEIKRLK